VSHPTVPRRTTAKDPSTTTIATAARTAAMEMTLRAGLDGVWLLSGDERAAPYELGS
jgi:hypothetical protein